MIPKQSEGSPRRTLWDISALVYARTYNDDAHKVDDILLTRLADRVSDGTILDAGCGPGVVVRKALDHGARRVVGVDISEPMLAQLPEDERVVGLHADVTPELIARLADEQTDQGFDLVVFKRSLYQSPDKARELLAASFEATSPRGVVLIVHPETQLRQYLQGTSATRLARAGHGLYHGFNRAISRALDALGIHEYRTYQLDELLELASSASPDAVVEPMDVDVRAFNVVTMSRGGLE